ncbi:hypothetical protein LXA43DRAFT_1006809 [Ganoderma leucocontextum]|nr:hypothetical protein LXA43DRAFT_1006809 [Ganoderma leucocontextum]
MSSRPPPLRASYRPPTYRMVTRVYNNSLRPVVVVIASVFAIWCLICYTHFCPTFKATNANIHRADGQPKFAIFDIVLGTIYATACAIEVFGVIAATTQRLAMVRIYAMLSLVAAVAVVGAAFLRVIIHFVYKDGLISECTQVAQGQGVTFRFGIWGPPVNEHLNAADAATFCNNAWSRDSLDEILFLIFEILCGIFFTMIAFAYYHQVGDPTSAANVSRTPANPLRDPVGQYPDHYNRPYDAEDGGYNAAPWQQNAMSPPQYAPPPGPPPRHADMGYGVGVGMGHDGKDAKDGERDLGVKGDNESDMTKFDDPFADFDGPSKPKSPPPHQF